MLKYKLVNNVTGWVVFLIAALTYCLTIEPTASFWDCPEFITTADKLEVGHPPGAPFFMLFGKFFTLFASDASEVAMMVNIMNALLSAACILFLFWSITHLARKLICRDMNDMSMAKTIAIMSSGVGGALIYTWSDTFWFSAVEGEVYAFSSFFTALVFWLILKWEDEPDGPRSDRWLILISYLIGLSIGVHLLNLLCIPAIVLIYYFKRKENPNFGGALLVLVISLLLIAAVLYGMVPGITKVGGVFEIIFVNWFGLPFNTGVVVYILVLLGAIVWGLFETHKPVVDVRSILSFILCVTLMGIPFIGHGGMSWVIGFLLISGLTTLLFVGCFTNQRNQQKTPYRPQQRQYAAKIQKKSVFTPRLLNTTLLCLTLMTVGYSSYALIVIRSSANPPMDQNSPRDIFTLAEYLGREQYGDRPLFYGPTYASEGEFKEDNQMEKYVKEVKRTGDEPDRYKTMPKSSSSDYDYPSDQCMFFPRIYSRDHKAGYEAWLGKVKKETVKYKGKKLEIPTGWENFKFFASYQVNHMYFRYFLWNFAGRQNDIQNADGNYEHGNWVTGISFWDNARLGDQDLLPDDLKQNKGNNVFYCLPLLLGLLGLFWQAFKGIKGVQQFWVVFFLFFMTGLAIVFYLNQTPNQPRERDYAYAGSFYAFAIWCGLGVTAIYDWLKELFKGLKNQPSKTKEWVAVGIAIVPALVVPIQMVSQTWDDHDRSDRYMCRDFGLNYLETIPENGIIFTNGDNDTFPLWYNEDTEGNRTDVRVCNLSYLATDWYINQMKRPAFDSDPLPISWQHYQYQEGENDYVRINPLLYYDVEFNDGTSQLMSPEEASSLPNEKRYEISDVMPLYMDQYIELAYKENPAMATEIFGKKPYADVPTVVVEADGNTQIDTVSHCFDYHQCVKKFLLKQYPNKYKDEVLVKEIPITVGKLPACLPSEKLFFKVDKEAVKNSGMKTYGKIPDYMVMDLKDRLVGDREGYMYKNFMMMVEIIAQTNFSRPVFMSTTVGPDNFGNLCKHFVLEGMAWRITPYTFKENKYEGRNADVAMCDVNKMYTNMMTKYHYGNLRQEGLYIDETVQRMCYTHRRWFSELIKNLLKDADKLVEKADDSEDATEKAMLTKKAKGLKDKALKALEKCEKEIPEYNVQHNFGTGSLDLAKAYLTLGKIDKGKHILDELWKKNEQYYSWYISFCGGKNANSYLLDARTQVAMMGYVVRAYAEVICHGVDNDADLKKLGQYMEQRNGDFKKYYNHLLMIGGGKAETLQIEDVTTSIEVGSAYLHLNKMKKGHEVLDKWWKDGKNYYNYMMDPTLDKDSFTKQASNFLYYLDSMDEILDAYYDVISQEKCNEQELEKLTELYMKRKKELKDMNDDFDQRCIMLGLY